MRDVAAHSTGVRHVPRSLPLVAWITLLVAGAGLGPGAIFGGWLLVTEPDGSGLQMPVSWLQYSPFSDYFIPGLILLTVFGIGSYVVVAAGLLRLSAAPYLAFALGVGQLIWITVQLGMVRTWHPVMHPALLIVGTVLAAGSYLWWRAWHPAT